MKKLLLLMFAIAGMAPLYAQVVYNSSSWTENMFNSQKPNSLPSNFTFRLPKGNMMILEMMDIQQLKSLVDIDSLIEKVWKDLQPLMDSLSKPLVSRRVDYNTSPNGAQIRIVEYPQRGSTYKYVNDELVQTKIEQDTLRIRLNTPYKSKRDTGIRIWGKPYFVMLYLNNLSAIESLPAGSLNAAIDLLKKDIDSTLNKSKKKNWGRYYAMYDVANQKNISPFKSNYFGYGKRKYYEPYIQLGIQYLRGSWAPSTGVGMQLIHGRYDANREVFKLYWEPFFFTRNSTNNLISQRNDFITFKYNEVRKVQPRDAEIFLNFSIGYLVGRRGNWFEPNTFKFAVPGLGVRNINLEPEFVFNKFFKNFSPSLRLTLEIE